MASEPLREAGKLLIVFGAVLLAVGALLAFNGKLPARLGRLPGDIIVRRENFTFYFPLATSLLLSVILSFVFRLLGRR